ncbi:hypothetical protein [Lunatimonas salinarum]|uniref:hypothetical protein n=1 Tax=Lunatimonas salinarum TaxID=1774590 RepID=UPI001ADEE3D3|nr:hypothetical protein [Lunatimonas salinarum]
MKFLKNYTPIFLAGMMTISGCELIDPTEVINPNLTEDAILSTANPMAPWVRGVRRQLALTTNEHVVLTEIGSDNYQNVMTFYNQNLDRLTIRPVDTDINAFQRELHRLREMADYGLNIVSNADAATTADQIAELNFLKGYSMLLSGEYFTFLPIAPGGEAVGWQDILNASIAAFSLAENSTDPTISAAATLAKARAYYRLGNKTEAVTNAQAAISKSSNLLYQVQFDQAQAPLNRAQTAMFDRGNFDDLQALPRLDFLDPKYYFRGASEASPVTLFKIEEAHLIIAEAQVSDGNLSGAESTLKSLLELVNGRPTSTFNNDQQDRTQNNPGSRPDKANVAIAASPQDPLRSGLVLDRKTGDITVPTISGTSVTSQLIEEALDSEETALELVYLLRQEIFIGEGRRLADMGVRLVISEIEYLANENIDEDHPGTVPVIPPFIQSINTEIDAFTYDVEAGTAIITHNINRIISTNRNNEWVAPFH